MGWFDNLVDSTANFMTAGTYGLIKDGKLGGNVLMGKDEQGNPIYSSDDRAKDRQADMDAGYAKGKEIFYDDPEMKALKARREDLAKGYSGEELGAIRGVARGEIAGQRDADQRRLSSNLARGGVGGARGAAIRGAADQKAGAQVMDAERKMALDSANMVRSGTNDLQDFIFRQKYGTLGTGLGYAQLGVADRTAAAQAAANNQKQDKGVVGGILDSFF